MPAMAAVAPRTAVRIPPSDEDTLPIPAEAMSFSSRISDALLSAILAFLFDAAGRYEVIKHLALGVG